MYIAATNFVFPVLFSLVQLIIVYQEVNTVIVNEIVFVNTSIAVIGVVFASIWAGSGHRSDVRLQLSGTQMLSNTRGTPKKVEISTVVFEKSPAIDNEWYIKSAGALD